jgi:hypothetical protein
MKQSSDSIAQQVELPVLTTIEQKYFKHLLINLGNVVSAENLRCAVYGEQAQNSKSLVSKHVGNLARKLDRFSRDRRGSHYKVTCSGTGGNGYSLVLIPTINSLDSPDDIACVEPRELRLDGVNLWVYSNHFDSNLYQAACIHSWAIRKDGGGLASINIVGDLVPEGSQSNPPLKIAILFACFELGHLFMLCSKDQLNSVDIYSVTSESTAFVGTEDVLMNQEPEQLQEAISRTKFLRRNIDKNNLGKVNISVVAKNALVQAFDKCIWDQLIEPTFKFYALRWFDSFQTLLVCGLCEKIGGLQALYTANPYGFDIVHSENINKLEKSALLRHALSDLLYWRDIK